MAPTPARNPVAPDHSSGPTSSPRRGLGNGPVNVVVRRAKTSDVAAIRALVDLYSEQNILLSKETVTLYENVQEFWVAVADSLVIGCGALHVLWQDLAEVRTVAVSPDMHGHGVGAAVLRALLDQARELGVSRVFCLTFETEFFAAHGFVEVQGTPVEPEVYEAMLRSYDEGVAEFLELDRVKPNTLGNARMLLEL